MSKVIKATKREKQYDAFQFTNESREEIFSFCYPGIKIELTKKSGYGKYVGTIDDGERKQYVYYGDWIVKYTDSGFITTYTVYNDDEFNEKFKIVETKQRCVICAEPLDEGHECGFIFGDTHITPICQKCCNLFDVMSEYVHYKMRIEK